MPSFFYLGVFGKPSLKNLAIFTILLCSPCDHTSFLQKYSSQLYQTFNFLFDKIIVFKFNLFHSYKQTLKNMLIVMYLGSMKNIPRLLSNNFSQINLDEDRLSRTQLQVLDNLTFCYPFWNDPRMITWVLFLHYFWSFKDPHSYILPFENL